MSDWDLPKNVEKVSTESVGGYLWESGVYKATVKMAYLDQAKSGAISGNIVLENSDGKELKEAFYIKSGNAKGNKTYYERDGKSYPLPGYSTANSLCVAAADSHLSACLDDTEKKMVLIYDYEERKEVHKERPVIMPLLNKSITVAVHQIIQNKNVKNDAGEYVPSGETRSINECKFFGNADGKSAEEMHNNSDAAVFDKWAKKNVGIVIDKSSKSLVKNTPSTSASIFNQSDDSPPFNQ